MKSLITQVGTYLTGDATADAVLEYWKALAEERRSDVVEIPVVGPAGGRSSVRVTLGAMLPIAVVHAELSPQIEDDDKAAVGIRARAHALTPTATSAFDSADVPEVFDPECESDLV
ncbi:hypothetical protein AKG07_04845 [Microbacterium sp. CGR1]|jgi:hypothetical protein|uniref:hypothetical protein n=1 Tax=Microbacterium sp. CGR1 TaxID=1696072 RepID=UPI00069D13C5|nr:hypothetical protein [Microbacterium sp. CGR1]AKV85731.1 hypothetical protein AKG07_04845 [Microbacterium sp. CGR1]